MGRVSRICVVALAAVPALALGQDVDVVGEIALQGRDALDVVIRAPYRDARSPDSRTSNLQMIDAIDKALHENTTLFAREAKESRNLIDAKGDTIAILKAVRSDVDLDRLRTEGKQIDDHNRERRALGERPARFLAVITVVPKADKSRVSVVLVDADDGLALLLNEEGRASSAELDQRFQSDAVIGRPAPAQVGDDAETASYLTQLFTRDLRPILENAGVWDELGTIELSTNVNDAEIRLDGQLVGTTRRGVTRLRDAPLGPHRLELAASGYAPFEIAVQVGAGRVERVDGEMEASGGLPSVVRDSAFWTGIGLGIAGVAFATWGATSGAAEGPVFNCVTMPCDGASWVRPGRLSGGVLPESGIAGAREISGEGPALIPLGYSLALTGAVWSLGPWLFETNSDEIPWVSLVVGVAAGALSYGLSEAFEAPLATTR